jgi:threonine dehydrogenase-like Zn-dependent dehydrogenase
MKAAVFHGRHDVRIEEVPSPTGPGRGELLLRSLKAGICGTDAAEFGFGPLMISLDRPRGASGHTGPVVLGHEFVGEVMGVGADVTGFVIGDRVVPGSGVWCGECEWCRAGRYNLCESYFSVGLHVDGGLAEFATVPAFTCAHVPKDCSEENAAMAQPLAIALHGLRRAAAKRGETVVVLGVGGIGAFVLAAAASLGLAPLIAVDVSREKLASARAIAPDATTVLASDRTAQEISDLTGRAGAHLVIEASGAPSSPGLALEIARRGGRILLLGLQTAPRPLDLHEMVIREVDMFTSVAHICPEDLPQALQMLTERDLASILVDHVTPLDRLVEDGLMPLLEGRARGKILVQP